jgi:hypothetical protein
MEDDVNVTGRLRTDALDMILSPAFDILDFDHPTNTLDESSAKIPETRAFCVHSGIAAYSRLPVFAGDG